jgi:hypothetical protein
LHVGRPGAVEAGACADELLESDDGELTLFSAARYHYRVEPVAYSLFRCSAQTTSSATPSRFRTRTRARELLGVRVAFRLS